GGNAGADVRFLLQEVTQFAQQFCILAELLHEDVFGSVEGGFGIVDLVFGVEVFNGFGFGVQGGVGQQGFGQGFQAGLFGDLAFGAALGFVGQVEVFETVLGVGLEDVAFQFGGQFFLFGNALEDGRTTVFQFTQVTQPFFQGAHLAVVQPAGHFFTVARDKGDCGAFVQQRNRCADLLLIYI